MIENIMSNIAKHNVTLTMAPTAFPSSDCAAVCAEFNTAGRTDYDMLPVLIERRQWAAQSAEFLWSLSNDLCNLLNRPVLAPVRGRPPAITAAARTVRAPTPAPPADGGVVAAAAQENAPPSPVPSSVNDPAKLRLCRGCNEMVTHNKATCPKMPCKNCNELGHLSRDCKEEKKKKAAAVGAVDGSDASDAIDVDIDVAMYDEATSSEQEDDDEDNEDSYEEDAKSVKTAKTGKSVKSVKGGATSSKAKAAAPKAKKAAAPKAKAALKRKRDDDSDSEDEDAAPAKKGKKAKKVVIDIDED